jgi:type I restriction enzyme S subunit
MQLGEITEPKIDQAGPQPCGGFTYVDISSVDNNAKRIVDPKRLPADSAPSRARQRLRSGDVLVSMTRPNLNAVALVPPELDGAIGSTGFHVLRARDGVLPQWLYYGVQTRQFVGAMSELVQGALYPAVRPKDIRAFDMPLPALDEQRRIVAELEKQFSRLDEAVANLKRVEANLKRYKAAVLKAAAEGNLVPTEAELARREGRTFETGGQVLARLLERREGLWKGKGKYADPCPPDTTDLPPLPDGWTYATAEQLTDPNRTITYGVIKLGPPVDGGVPILRSSDVRSLRIDLEGVKTIAPSIAAEYRRTFLEGGEVIITVRGTLGGIAVAPSACRGFNVSREVAMLAMVEPELAHTIAQFIASAPIQKWLMTRTKGIAYTGINIETLKALPLPVPPLHEQRRIRAETERLLSLVAELELEIESNMLRAQRLTQSTLQHVLGAGP